MTTTTLASTTVSSLSALNEDATARCRHLQDLLIHAEQLMSSLRQAMTARADADGAIVVAGDDRQAFIEGHDWLLEQMEAMVSAQPRSSADGAQRSAPVSVPSWREGAKFALLQLSTRDASVAFLTDSMQLSVISSAVKACKVEIERLAATTAPSANEGLQPVDDSRLAACWRGLTDGSLREYMEDYEFRGDDGDYTPSEGERLVIQDAVWGWISEVQDAVAAKIVSNKGEPQ